MEGAIDVRMFESGNGGDILLRGNDFVSSFSFESMPYLGMFGGNPGFPTPRVRKSEEEAFDYWGNSLLFADAPEEQFNSITEYTLSNVTLNSGGRLEIEEAVKKDLSFMTAFSDINVNVSILGDAKVGIAIDVIRANNEVDKKFLFIWDNFELFEEGINYSSLASQEGLEEGLQFDIG